MNILILPPLPQGAVPVVPVVPVVSAPAGPPQRIPSSNNQNTIMPPQKYPSSPVAPPRPLIRPLPSAPSPPQVLFAPPTSSPHSSQSEWYFETMQRIEAENLLTSFTSNCFLIRPSSTPGSFAVSKFDYGTQKLGHWVVAPSNGGFVIKDSPDKNVYPTLVDLVHNTPELSTYRPVGELKKGM